jgi:hypothetical protein
MLGVDNVPSHNTMKEMDTALQNACGILSIRYPGALGNIYYANDLAAIIAQVCSYSNFSAHLKLNLKCRRSVTQ